jgi:saccharopine dehydrogenase-like NADP-dependent oxidoreductase
MKMIVVFGAGKSATALISYLRNVAIEKNWKLIVADTNLAAIQAKLGEPSSLLQAVACDVTDAEQRNAIIQVADVVISLMPPQLHFLIAQDCITHGKHLLTASYVDDNMRSLAAAAKAKGILFLCEMGLDPGIDHMSAMEMIHRIQAKGGKITGFYSHCGGLVAPESDDNPWHYKISWNPKNVVDAGKAGARFRRNGQLIDLPYEQVFEQTQHVTVARLGSFTAYANRDSVSYMPLYGLEHATNFIRTTLRYSDFIVGWRHIIQKGLTNSNVQLQKHQLTGLGLYLYNTPATQESVDWYNDIFDGKAEQALALINTINELQTTIEQTTAEGMIKDGKILTVNDSGTMQEHNLVQELHDAQQQLQQLAPNATTLLDQMMYLFWSHEEALPFEAATPAQALQYLLEQRLALQPTDKDMVVMQHEIEYECDNICRKATSSLVLKGTDAVHTAMAQTVGLPLGIAAIELLEGNIQLRGLHIPIVPEIYEPVLQTLQANGIAFEEFDMAIV